MLDLTTEHLHSDPCSMQEQEFTMTAHYPIRRVQSGDAAALHDLLTAKHVIEGSMRMPYAPLSSTEARLQEQPDRFQLVAEHDGEVVGYAEVLTAFAIPRIRHSATLNMVATREDMQSRGVCSALLGTVIAQCTDHWGLRRLGLIVWAHNTTAIRLYEKYGFEHEGRFQDYVRCGNAFKDALAMAKLFPRD